MDTFLEMWRSGFLRDSLIASLLVGFFCPLVGVYFVLRRMVFLGVALPQVSMAGIAFSFYVYTLMNPGHEHEQAGEQMIALVGSFAFTLLAMMVLAFFERRRETVEARIGVTYALAAAATMFFLAKDPQGQAQTIQLLKGELLAATWKSLSLLGGVLGGVALALIAFRKELLLVSFDRDLAIVFRKRAGLWDLVLYLLIGAVISVGVMTAGPLPTFGFLVVPPVTMRMVAGRMLTFTLGSALLGAISAFVGFYCSLQFDVPVGCAEVGVASLALLSVGGTIGAARAIRRWRGA